jgi:copper oxidase (laccase) domain-containing protein
MQALPKMVSQFPQLHFATSEVSDGNFDFRFGPEDEVMQNRRRFFSQHGIPHERCAGVSLEHDARCIVIEEKDLSDCAVVSPKADALITSLKNAYLFMKVSDCYVAVVYDPVQNVLALVHCGAWNTGKGIIENASGILKSTFGTAMKDVAVYFSPGIKKESYRLATHFFWDKFADNPEWMPYVTDLQNGYMLVDTLGLSIEKFLRQGVRAENIESSPCDTGVDRRFFSHYRNIRFGHTEGRTGTVVGMRHL